MKKKIKTTHKKIPSKMKSFVVAIRTIKAQIEGCKTNEYQPLQGCMDELLRPDTLRTCR
jgi:hypothetical protein